MGFFKGEWVGEGVSSKGAEFGSQGGQWQDSTVSKLRNRWKDWQATRSLAQQERQREAEAARWERVHEKQAEERQAEREKKQKQPDSFYFQKLPLAERTYPVMRKYDGLACAKLIGSNHVEYMDEKNGKPVFVDAGQRVGVSPPPTAKGIEQGLKHMAERNSNPIQVSGSPQFLRDTAAAAVKMGIADRLKGMPEKVMQQAVQQATENTAREKQAEQKAVEQARVLASEKEREIAQHAAAEAKRSLAANPPTQEYTAATKEWQASIKAGDQKAVGENYNEMRKLDPARADEAGRNQREAEQSDREFRNAQRYQPRQSAPVPEPDFLKDIKERAKQQEQQKAGRGKEGQENLGVVAQAVGVPGFAEAMAKPSVYQPQKELKNDKGQPQIEYREIERAKAKSLDESKYSKERTKALDADTKSGTNKATTELEKKMSDRGEARDAREKKVAAELETAEGNLKTSLINISGRPNPTQRLAEQLTAIESYHQERAKIYERAQIGETSFVREVELRHLQGDAQKARIQVDDVRKQWQNEHGQASSPEMARMTRESAGFKPEQNQILVNVDLKSEHKVKKEGVSPAPNAEIQKEYKQEADAAQEKQKEKDRGYGIGDD